MLGIQVADLDQKKPLVINLLFDLQATNMDMIDANLTTFSPQQYSIGPLPRYVLLSLTLLVGLPGIFLNALTVYIKTKYSKQYGSPTYVFMVQRAVADILVLTCICIGTAIFIIFPYLPTQCRILQDIFAFALNIGWHPGCNFLCFIVYSRYVALCDND
uniref:G-protein coupled receptors family 1 profile domain-containing protein n=1 Tax=Romanomermis culicivorax TaxID=13658 RepID=A0A915KX45_ROMCU